MSGADNVDFNTLERALSSDIDLLQSVQARFLADLLAQTMSTKGLVSGAGSPTNTIADRVLGGLVASVNGLGVDVDVSPGALVQNSASISPVPGAYDSDYRMAISRSVQTLVSPTPGANTFYLLEAQMTDVVVSTQNRDIFNTGTGLFVSTPVPKIYERQIQFQFRAGTATQAPAPQANWVPIAIVFRTAGGGALGTADIIDVRPLWNEYLDNAGADTTLEAGQLIPQSVPNARVNTALFELACRAGGRRLFARTTGSPINLSTETELQESGLVLSNGRLYYLYLAPWQGLHPKNAYDLDIEHQGLLILSAVPPDNQGRNSANITPPSPFAVSVIAGGAAFCVGTLHRSGGAWTAMTQTRFGETTFPAGFWANNPILLATGATPGSLAVDLDTIGTGGTDIVPQCARYVDLMLNMTSATSQTIYVNGNPSADTYAGVVMENSQDQVVRVPLTTERNFNVVGGAAGVLSVYLAGWGV